MNIHTCTPSDSRSFILKDLFTVALLSFVGHAILWYFGSVPSHYHQDEFITAYTSWTLPEIAKIDWFAGYPEIWVSRFPVLFHILQKPFLVLLGPLVVSIRISVWPYYVGIIVYLYFLSTMIGSRRLGFAATTIFIVLAPNVYLSSMGLHFISSTFFYLATVFHFFAYLRSRKRTHALWSGLYCALSYLTYTSSYVAYPVIAIIGILTIIRTRSTEFVIGLVKLSALVLVILAPFLAHAATLDNYFFQRINQVNVFWGSWSETARLQISFTSVVSAQLVNALRSIVLPGIGGLGGYNFGKHSLLDPLTAFLLIVGFLFLLLDAIRRDHQHFLYLLIVFMVPFITGFVLTTHPPPFHRLSILYPWIALIIALAVTRVTMMVKRYGYTLIIVILSLVVVANLRHAGAMIRADAVIYPQNSRVIGDVINRTVPKGETIFIASYPAFYLPQELLFRTNNRYPIVSEESESILKRYDGGFLIVFKPSEGLVTNLSREYPANRWLRTLEGVNLGDLALFVPQRYLK